MSRNADALIDELGGTTRVSELTKAPLSTVHSWRTKISESRLEHLKLLKEQQDRAAEEAPAEADEGAEKAAA